MPPKPPRASARTTTPRPLRGTARHRVFAAPTRRRIMPCFTSPIGRPSSAVPPSSLLSGSRVPPMSQPLAGPRSPCHRVLLHEPLRCRFASLGHADAMLCRRPVVCTHPHWPKASPFGLAAHARPHTRSVPPCLEPEGRAHSRGVAFATWPSLSSMKTSRYPEKICDGFQISSGIERHRLTSFL